MVDGSGQRPCDRRDHCWHCLGAGRFLLGDVNQSRVVSVSDLGLIRAQLSQTVTTTNFLRDLNASGAISLADLGMANGNLTRTLPPP
jgi:hypothetical protein